MTPPCSLLRMCKDDGYLRLVVLSGLIVKSEGASVLLPTEVQWCLVLYSQLWSSSLWAAAPTESALHRWEKQSCHMQTEYLAQERSLATAHVQLYSTHVYHIWRETSKHSVQLSWAFTLQLVFGLNPHQKHTGAEACTDMRRSHSRSYICRVNTKFWLQHCCTCSLDRTSIPTHTTPL